MLAQIVMIYCICDEVSKTFNIKDDIQCKMSSAEIMTFAIMSASIYGGDYRKTRLVASTYRYFSKILSHSQLVRRIHQIPEQTWYMTFLALQLILKNRDNQFFIVDSFPVKAYENHKSFRAKIFSGKKFHGYTASKKQYFFGIKVHMIIDTDGIPIEFLFSPGSSSDIKSLQDFSLVLCLERVSKIFCQYFLGWHSVEIEVNFLKFTRSNAKPSMKRLREIFERLSRHDTRST